MSFKMQVLVEVDLESGYEVKEAFGSEAYKVYEQLQGDAWEYVLDELLNWRYDVGKYPTDTDVSDYFRFYCEDGLEAIGLRLDGNKIEEGE